MTPNLDTSLADEWQSLHCSHEKYEHIAMGIKLFAVALTVIIYFISLTTLLAWSLLGILWLQEGILKTFQARASQRLEKIENSIANLDNNNEKGFQFYSQWSAERPSNVGLIMSYISNALKPTVVYPYLPLMLISLFF